MSSPTRQGQRPHWREVLRIIIFEAETPAGKAFDVGLLLAICASVLTVILESVASIEAAWGDELRIAEWFFTLVFAFEYAMRLITVPHAGRYARSFFGIVDLASILPTPLSLLFPGSQSLLVVRALRLLRIFRIFKLVRFLGEANVLARALHASRHKIMVFVGTVMVIVVIMGAAMFTIEGAEHGFTSIPRSMYWAIVTMTTVGYGDISPQTVPGQIMASILMVVGYGIIAIPTGIVTAEIVSVSRGPVSTRVCADCLSEGHDARARYCRDCGAELR